MSKSTYAIYSEPNSYTSMQTSPISEVCLHREGMNKIVISTLNPLDDDQMSDIYWIVSAMQKTGKRLKDMFGGQE